MSDCDFDGFCTGDCPGPVPDFRGSFWGVTGKYLTRLPEYIKSHLQTQPVDCGDPYYTYPRYRPHPTLSRELPNLTHEGVEYECFGAASTMIADMAKLSTIGSRPCYLWAQLHYVPVGEKNLDNAIAALARAHVGDYVEGVATATLGEPTVWLVNDANGDPEVWDSYDKLDIYTETKKAFCGSSNFGWIEKRMPSASSIRFTIYSLSVATPSVVTHDNGARGIDAYSHFQVADVSRDCYPLAVGARPKFNYFADSSISSSERIWVVGELNIANGRIVRPATIDSDIWDLFTDPDLGTTNSAVPSGFVERTDEDAIAIGTGNSGVRIISWEASAVTLFEPDPENPSETITYKTYSDVVISCTTSPFDGYTISSEPTDPSLAWYRRATAFNAGLPYDGRFDEVPVGSGDAPLDPNGRVLAHPVRVLPVGFSYRGNQENSAGGPQQVLGISVKGQNPDLGGGDAPGVLFREDFDAWNSAPMVPGVTESDVIQTTIRGFVVRPGNIDMASAKTIKENVYDDVPLRSPQPYAGTIRTPLDQDSGSTPTPIVRIIGVGFEQERASDQWFTSEGDSTNAPDTSYLPDGWKWSNSRRPDIAIERAPAWTALNGAIDSEGNDERFGCAPFYDSSRDGILQTIPAPSGFFQTTVDGKTKVYRGNFAIQQRQDDHHPTEAMIWEPGTTGFIE